MDDLRPEKPLTYFEFNLMTMQDRRNSQTNQQERPRYPILTPDRCCVQTEPYRLLPLIFKSTRTKKDSPPKRAAI